MHEDDNHVQKIGVALDESAEAQRAFHSAVELAKLMRAELTIITVIEHLPAYIGYVSAIAPDVPLLLENQRRAFYEDMHALAQKEAAAAGVHLHSKIVEGNEIEALLHEVRETLPDLLVVGLRYDPTGLSRFIGGTAHQLALHTRCDVLGIR